MYEFKKIKKITIFESGIIRPYNQIEQGQRNKKSLIRIYQNRLRTHDEENKVKRDENT